jgi:hypothetical protein
VSRRCVTLREYLLHYKRERNHQGKGNILLFPSATTRVNPRGSQVRCRERLVWLLRYYYQEAELILDPRGFPWDVTTLWLWGGGGGWHLNWLMKIIPFQGKCATRSSCPLHRLMVRLLRHRQTKGAVTDRLDLRPPRHILTLPRLLIRISLL